MTMGKLKDLLLPLIWHPLIFTKFKEIGLQRRLVQLGEAVSIYLACFHDHTSGMASIQLEDVMQIA